jgi:hypothetical protein
MTDFEALAANLCKRPGMYVGCETFAAVCAYLSGFDAARDNGPLGCFRAWMVLRRGYGHNTGWEWLVVDEAIGSLPGRDLAEIKQEQDKLCVKKLGDLLGEFFEERRRRLQMSILSDYVKWLRRKRLYDSILPRG